MRVRMRTPILYAYRLTHARLSSLFRTQYRFPPIGSPLIRDRDSRETSEIRSRTEANRSERKRTKEPAAAAKSLRGWFVNTLLVLIDESLISQCVTSGVVTDANNNASEDRKIGSDTLRSPTLGNCIDLHTCNHEFLSYPSYL